MGRIGRRRILLAACALLAPPWGARAQAQGRVHRIGLLLITSRKHPGADKLLAPFLAGLRERGYVEGRNLSFDWREAEGRFEQLHALAVELVDSKPDLVVAGHHDAAVALRQATQTIPIVIVGGGDLVAAGLVKSLARPGTNATGVAGVGETLYAKQLELLRDLAPRIRRVALLLGAGASQTLLPALLDASTALGLTAIVRVARSEQDLEDAFTAIIEQRAEGLLVLLDALTYIHRERIARFAIAHRIPSVSSMAQFAQAGGLAAYSSTYVEYWRMAVDYVDRILKGAHPADLAVQMPLKFDLVVNLTTARAIELAVPRQVLLRADRVIE